MKITFNKAYDAPKSLDYLKESLECGQTAGDGRFTQRCRKWLEEKLGGVRAFLTPSCTAALEMSALLLGIEPGDEVIVPSFTFVSTASAFALFGAKILFADICRETLALDPEQIARLRTPRTRAVATVHYAGVSADPQIILKAAAAADLPLVEDNAHALGGSFDGKSLGTFGKLATLSFHESKNFSCGEGGALLVNDPALVERAEILREKGTNRSAHLRREVAKYTWVDLGSSYLASDLCAAALLAQLEDFDIVQGRRRLLWDRYFHSLQAWASENGVRLPIVPAGCDHANHLFYILMPNAAAREAAIRWLKEAQIEAYFHYLPLHLSPQGRRCGTALLGCPVTESVSECLLRLPLYPGLKDEEQERVISRLIQFQPPC